MHVLSDDLNNRIDVQTQRSASFLPNLRENLLRFLIRILSGKEDDGNDRAARC